MKCTRIGCDADTRVLSTRDDVRRRECFNGHRFTTFEVTKEERDHTRKELSSLNNIRQAILVNNSSHEEKPL